MNTAEAIAENARLGRFGAVHGVDHVQDHRVLEEVVVERTKQLRGKKRQKPAFTDEQRGPDVVIRSLSSRRCQLSHVRADPLT